ncbi:MAG: hypothetical protein EXX96DRAFT_610455 [Benjaminiella poitrasii]|nr:MAG: hypothetical protein EXX96DRAFT_610455 [Benjaminiella poitrasii]
MKDYYMDNYNQEGSRREFSKPIKGDAFVEEKEKASVSDGISLVEKKEDDPLLVKVDEAQANEVDSETTVAKPDVTKDDGCGIKQNRIYTDPVKICQGRILRVILVNTTLSIKIAITSVQIAVFR